ncbi:MAG: hypothetical protein MR832_05315 [Clostridiales bacterium]|nr:hypothetical protein [Clostridiales bacterium]
MQKEWDSPVFATNIESRFENDTPRQPDSCGCRIRIAGRESTGEKESSESFFTSMKPDGHPFSVNRRLRRAKTHILHSGKRHGIILLKKTRDTAGKLVCYSHILSRTHGIGKRFYKIQAKSIRKDGRSETAKVCGESFKIKENLTRSRNKKRI